jgi:hypothetical protein
MPRESDVLTFLIDRFMRGYAPFEQFLKPRD